MRIALAAATVLLASCGPTPVSPGCTEDKPLYCYWQNESKRAVCCPEDLPHACIGTNICAISEDWCPQHSVLCEAKTGGSN